MELKDHFGQLFKSRPQNALEPDWDDLKILYDLVLIDNPNIVVEFGSGCSTVVMAYAMRKNGKGKIISFESDKYWFDKNLEIIPNFLKGIAELYYRPCSQNVYAKTPVLFYLTHSTSIIPETIDMIYVDGPELIDKFRITANPLTLEDRLSDDGKIVVDGRKETVEFLKNNLKRTYEIQTYAHGNGFNIFTLLE